MRYLLAAIVRESTDISVAELLRKGSTLTRQVRDNIPRSFDSSESQQTWVPSDSQAESNKVPQPHNERTAAIHWDRELACILGLTIPSSSTSFSRSPGASTCKHVTNMQYSQDQEPTVRKGSLARNGVVSETKLIGTVCKAERS